MWETYIPLALIKDRKILLAQPERPDGAQSQDPRHLMAKGVQMAKEAFGLLLARRSHRHRDTQSPGLALPRCVVRIRWHPAIPRYDGRLSAERQDVVPAGTPALGGVIES